MQNFLYLRIVTITCSVLLITCMILILASWEDYVKSDILHVLIGNELVFGIFAGQSIFILSIYYKYYPDKDVPKLVHILYRITDAIVWLCLLFLVATIIALLFFDTQKTRSNNSSVALTICAILSVLLLIQLIGGARLLKTIRRNARFQLENSFA